MYAPQLTSLLLLVGGVAATAVPSDAHFGTLLARQAPGTPAYDCHFNCGSTISGGRIEGHCDNATWIGYYHECLECADEFNIWQYYGNGVTAAAATCDLTAEPSPSESAAPSTSTSVDAPATESTTTSDVPSDAVSTTSAAESTAEPTAEPTADSSATDAPTTPLPSAPAETTTVPTADGGASNTTAPTSSATFVTVSGALKMQMTGSMLGLGAVVALGLKALW
ncbi:hypothetical protein CONLIGDRAFT_631812 [Coniochaeta ligniaria NRRL 30616]|uniref:Uncharacterized protein n=1 Tax=Coniochaeta ligniaria NRRL 30616 TaxID=1408157 RepID=A0A1J7IQ41_9PEZI|nr:hypothetical protein CONLIGDRAFT_631812 [Coniochaeta ligniaria NRRL 30616]